VDLRRKIQSLFGAKLVLTPRALGTKGAIDQAKELVANSADAVLLDQFSNPANPSIHETTTAEELWADTKGKVDVVIAGVGTGGTIMGLSRCFKSRNPNVQIIAVEPASCPVLSQGHSGVHKIQGLSSGHVPDILDRRALDEILTIKDDEAIAAARLLPVLEGISAGISSGAAVAAAIKVGQRVEIKGKTIAIILADAADRYVSTELFDGLAMVET
jgi:cysteine synthase A